MFKKIKHILGEGRAVAFATYKEWSAYRTHSLVSAFVGPTYFIVQYFVWKAVYGDTAMIAGMSFEAMVRYYGASALIGYLTMDFADWNLQMLIRTGKFLTFVLRPINHRRFALEQKLGHRVLGLVFEFIPCLLILWLLFGVDMRPVYIGWTILSIAITFLMNFYVNYTLGMTAFFLVNASGIRVVYQLFANVLSGALIPINFFPEAVRRIMMFLPFQYTNYIPAMVWTGGADIAGFGLSVPEAVMFQGIALVIMIGFSELLYRAAIRRFTAVGA